MTQPKPVENDMTPVIARIDEVVDTLDLIAFAIASPAVDISAKRSAILLAKRALIDISTSISQSKKISFR